MANTEPLSINSVAKKLNLSVHQLRRWELLFGLEIRRGKGQQRQYRPQDIRVLERIKELVDQGWPTTQISQQIETEGLVAPKLIGLPVPARNSEALAESIIGVRSFCERRLAEIGQQLSEIQQILMSLSLKQQMSDPTYSPWQPSFSNVVKETPAPPQVREIAPPLKSETLDANTVSIGLSSTAMPEITDQNYLTVLGKTLDLVGWSDGQADEYSMKNHGVSVWIDLGRSDAEKFIGYLRSISAGTAEMPHDEEGPQSLNFSLLSQSVGAAVDL
jgi:DNA-binding transcriptional MerR regulator